MPNSLPILIMRLDKSVDLPTRAHPGDAGLDLRAGKSFILPPQGGTALVPTGIAIAIPDGFAGLILPRSGLALDQHVTVLNSPGLIDSGYRGEIKVLLVNHNITASVKIERAERIAQLVVIGTTDMEWRVTTELPPSDREASGFGESGR
jgi:dUTP pyrophosphatase